jgi:penicillin-insensitive murein endopeptidase
MLLSRLIRNASTALVAGVTAATVMLPLASADQLAKTAFGAQKLPAVAAPQAIGFYSKGCFAGGVAIATDGPNWQAMRLSRNRRWGHPDLIRTVEQLSREAAADGWPGLLVGDISQPRGGPMLSGHASHQIGLDADIWLTPMPNRTFSASERESVSATSMLKGDSLYVDDRKWTAAHTALLRRAASYPQVERLLVHPGIKKKLCDTVSGDRSWLSKVRPFWGHFYHFHMRIGCPAGSPGCKEQADPPSSDGCDKSLAWWFTDEPWRPAPPGTPKKPPARDVMMLSQLPKACMSVLAAPAPVSEAVVTVSGPGGVPDAPAAAPLPAVSAFSGDGQSLPPVGPLIAPRPVR